MKTHECPTTKKCKVCLEIKVLSEFKARSLECKSCLNVRTRLERSTPEGKEKRSKECRKYYEANAAVIAEKALEYRSNNYELCLAKERSYRLANPDKLSGISRKCYEAHREQRLAYGKYYNLLNKDKRSKQAKEWRLNNLDRCVKNARKWRDANIERCKVKDKAWKEANPELVFKYEKTSYYKNQKKRIAKTKKWQLANPEKAAIIKRVCHANRRAAKLRASVSWKNKDKIKAIYKEAIRLTELTGIAFHVDHIVPLKGKFVTGLHCEANLQILPAYENMAKSNKFLVDDIVYS
jgi:hypothetical protein